MKGSTYHQLIQKIDAFTRKYYVNQIIRGSIYFVAVALAAFLISAILEYFGRFPTAVRMVLFYGLLAVYTGMFIRYILLPSLKLVRMGRLISHDEASRIIGAHFPDISDRLLNTLQLKRQAELSREESGLLRASIDQRIASLEPIPFSSAINFGDNRKYLKYVLPPVLLAVILLIVAPSVLRDGSERIVSYNVAYTPKAPFDFIIANDSLKVPLNEDFNLTVEARGDYIPSAMSLDLGGKLFRMKRNNDGSFQYTFRNVRNEVPFKLFADGFYSDQKSLEVLPTPSVVRFDVKLSYPGYLGMKDETLNNTGNLQIPEGTHVAWKFTTANTEAIYLQFSDTALQLNDARDGNFTYQRSIDQNEMYNVAALNSIVGGRDTIGYRINVIKDAYPQINVKAIEDSTETGRFYYSGTISDDHGFSRLVFRFTVQRAGHPDSVVTVPMNAGTGTAREFYQYMDFNLLNLKPGDAADYYFEVWDNDGVNGPKSTRTARKTFKAPTIEELDSQRKESDAEIKKKLEEGIKDAAELKKQLDELNKNLLQKNEMNWQDKKQIEDLLKKQRELEKNVNDLRNERKANQQNQEKYLEQSENIMRKQEQLEKMFDELMSPEMKEMYKKLEELMQKLDQDQVREELEKIKMSNEDLEKNLDRTLEIFKQMEFEQAFEKTMDKLEDLAEKQKDLAEETRDGEKSQEALQQEQEKLNKEFEDVQKELEDLEKKNSELESPNEMPDTKKQEEEIKQEQQKSSENLEQNKKKKASESQQNAGDKMSEMASQMKSAMAAQQAAQQAEDMEALRALLENIIQLSFDQESIMENLSRLDRDDPKYVELGRKQKKLEDDSKMVEDSLFALSKRVSQIAPIVNKEIGLVNQNIAKAIEEIGERKTGDATTHQQYAMTSYNNLALLLDEALQQMQMQMASQNPGKGNCEKPGGMGSKPSESNMSKRQEALSKKLDQLQKALKEGKNKDGQKPGMGNQGMSKELAKMAAEQAAIRREVEKMAEKLNEQGKGEGNGLKQIAEQMEENERDLVNEKITQETLKRQQEILTRLLKSEKAEREREYDNKRESNAPNPYEPSNPERYIEYNKRKAREVEMLRTLPPDLKPYYKERVNDYFLNFEN